jgi:hypothetical protein
MYDGAQRLMRDQLLFTCARDGCLRIMALAQQESTRAWKHVGKREGRRGRQVRGKEGWDERERPERFSSLLFRAFLRRRVR